nr:hypothetical protein [Tanacetum cinerariifolium]
EEQAAKAQNWKLPVCYDDDDDEESSKSLEDNIISELPSYSAITPSEPVDSLSMGDEHLNTILIDSLFDELAGELTLLKLIPPRIDETDCHPEKETRFAKRLLDILILEELLDNYSLSLPANESYHFDIPSPYRPLQNHQMVIQEL